MLNSYFEQGPSILALTVGDLKGIGPEVVAKALVHLGGSHDFRSVVIGHREVMASAFRRWAPDLEYCVVSGPRDEGVAPGAVRLWDPGGASGPVHSGMPEVEYIQAAASGCMDGTFDAMVTAPICKRSLYERGFQFPGHTEYLAQLTGGGHPVMMFTARELKVSLATIHVPLRKVPELLTRELLSKVVRTTAAGLQNFFGIVRPRLAVCGLNPHAGEGGHIGEEDVSIVAPVVGEMCAEGMQVDGPLPADSLFAEGTRARYDAVVALYHDQGLIPIKLIGFHRSVNLTLGLPIVRTSVDHGVAFDLAGKGIANSGSMEAAIETALEICGHRRQVKQQVVW